VVVVSSNRSPWDARHRRHPRRQRLRAVWDPGGRAAGGHPDDARPPSSPTGCGSPSSGWTTASSTRRAWPPWRPPSWWARGGAGRGVPAAPGIRSAADARPTQAHPLRVWGEPGGGGATAGTPPLLRHTVAGHVPRVPPMPAPDPRSLPCRSDDSGSRV